MTQEQFQSLKVGQIVYDYGTQGDVGDKMRVETVSSTDATARGLRDTSLVCIFTADATGIEVERRASDPERRHAA